MYLVILGISGHTWIFMGDHEGLQHLQLEALLVRLSCLRGAGCEGTSQADPGEEEPEELTQWQRKHFTWMGGDKILRGENLYLQILIFCTLLIVIFLCE